MRRRPAKKFLDPDPLAAHQQLPGVLGCSRKTLLSAQTALGGGSVDDGKFRCFRKLPFDN